MFEKTRALTPSHPHALMVPTGISPISLRLLLLHSWHFLHVSVFASPLRFPRDGRVSPSYASLSKPVVSPCYVYFGKNQTLKLVDAFKSLGMRAATVGLASAPRGQVGITCLWFLGALTLRVFSANSMVTLMHW